MVSRLFYSVLFLLSSNREVIWPDQFLLLQAKVLCRIGSTRALPKLFLHICTGYRPTPGRLGANS